MNLKILIPLCFATALMACSDRNNDTGVGGETTGTPDTTTATPDSTGGTAEMPPADTAPTDTPPPAPNQ